MIFSYNWLQSFFNKKLPNPKELADVLIRHAFEVEEVKKSGKDYLLDIAVLPNRAGDCFSHLGMARECGAILNLKLNNPTNLKISEDKKIKTKDYVSVEVKEKESCHRYTARVVDGVKVSSSPAWIQEKLISCGLRPINNIVDITNYVMLETGQPLHAFDSKKIEGNKIIVRFAKERENIITLDEQKFNLDSNILVIADNNKSLAIAGIKGGKMPEIDKDTKTIIIEAANFNGKTIRKGSKILKLKTDASLRFEHGIDLNLTEIAINRAASLIQKTAGGKIANGLIDIYSKKSASKTIKLDLNYLERLLGIRIQVKDAKSILERLEFKCQVSGNNITVKVPTFRLDIFSAEDLIEEVGRIYGYEKIDPVFPIASLIPPEKNLNVFWEETAKNILKESGFTEAYNYSFFGVKEVNIFNSDNQELVQLENPISAEQRYLRNSLIPNLLKNTEKNCRQLKEIKIFEFGKIFINPKKPKEKKMLTCLDFKGDFYQMKGIVNSLLNKIGISDIWYDEYRPTPENSKISIWDIKKCAEIKIGKEEVGFLGEISSKIINALNISGKVVLFDIDFDKISNIASEEHEYQPISKFPEAIRDIAVLVPRDVRVAEVLEKINTAGGNIVRDVDLFDIYEGEGLPEGMKNFAFHIIYQAEDKTLSSKEIDEIQNNIIKSLEEDPEWQIRK